MLIGIRTDDHFALNSSIIMGTQGSVNGRLDNLIKSYRWMYNLFYNELNVDMTMDLGDLTDSANLRSEEVTAITAAFTYRDTKVPELYVLGNHERLSSDGDVNSVNFLKVMPNLAMYTKPGVELYHEENNDHYTMIAVLPYGNYDETFLSEFIGHCNEVIKNENIDETHLTKLLLCHNDIYGADLGGWESKSGINPDKLSKYFDMTLNGHIHNGSWVRKNVLNVGSLSGQNFSSKFVNWEPSVITYDTVKNKVNFYVNPYALRFISIKANTITDLAAKLNSIDSNFQYGVNIKVPSKLIEQARSQVSQMNFILSSRIQEQVDPGSADEVTNDLVNFDGITGGYEKLRTFIDEAQLPSNVNREVLNKVVKSLSEGSPLINNEN